MVLHNMLPLTGDQILIINVIATPLVTLLTLWIKGALESQKRQDIREDGLIKGLELRVLALEKRLDEKEREIKEIRVELKNRDEEYIKLYKEHTTLKAKYEVLLIDHDKLRKEYEQTQTELTVLKSDIKKRAEISAESANKLTV